MDLTSLRCKSYLLLMGIFLLKPLIFRLRRDFPNKSVKNYSNDAGWTTSTSRSMNSYPTFHGITRCSTELSDIPGNYPKFHWIIRCSREFPCPIICTIQYQHRRHTEHWSKEMLLVRATYTVLRLFCETLGTSNRIEIHNSQTTRTLTPIKSWGNGGGREALLMRTKYILDTH